MRTTLDIQDDILMAAKELARSQRKSAGEVLSELARKGLAQPGPGDAEAEDELAAMGFYPMPRRGVIITNELIRQIREEEGI
jgi:hypothetical protein